MRNSNLAVIITAAAAAVVIETCSITTIIEFAI
jgi:hypothetical protein